MNVVHILQHMNIQKIQWKEQQDGLKDVKKHIQQKIKHYKNMPVIHTVSSGDPITAAWAITKIAGKSTEWTMTTAVAVALLLCIVGICVMLTLSKFKKENILIFDGAMGTMLQKNGLKTGELPENMNITNPQVLLKIHKEYLDAGCNVVTANTFGANSLKFDNVEEIIASAVSLAKKSIENIHRDCYVALDVGPLGKLLKPSGDLEFDSAYNLFKEQVIAGENTGADLILIETMGDLYEIKAAVLAAKENTALPVLVSMIFDEKGFEYGDYMIYVSALYAFIKISMSIYNFVKAQKQNDLIIESARNINLIDGAVSILALQTAMLYTFSDGAMDISLANTLTGSAVSICAYSVAIYMIVRAIKNRKEEDNNNNNNNNNNGYNNGGYNSGGYNGGGYNGNNYR